jgi:hypothetical protein
VGVCDEALGVTPGRTTSSADLGGKPPPFSFYISPSPPNGQGYRRGQNQRTVDITKNAIVHIKVNHMSTSGYSNVRFMHCRRV